MIKRKHITAVGSLAMLGEEHLVLCRAEGGAKIRAGFVLTGGESCPFVAMSNDEFSAPDGELADLAILVDKDGPKIVVTGAVESFSIDLFALARKLAEDPAMAQSISRFGLQLGQTPDLPKGD